MKKILVVLAIALGLIEDIILIPISIVIIAIGRFVCIFKDADFVEFAINYRWMVEGWCYKIMKMSKDDMRDIIFDNY